MKGLWGGKLQAAHNLGWSHAFQSSSWSPAGVRSDRDTFVQPLVFNY